MTTSKTVQPAQNVADESTMTPEPAAQIDAGIQGAIGRKLRESYEEVVKESVPDKLLAVLEQLKKKEQGDSTGGS
jgi:hypothetical protein